LFFVKCNIVAYPETIKLRKMSSPRTVVLWLMWTSCKMLGDPSPGTELVKHFGGNKPLLLRFDDGTMFAQP